VISVDKFCDKMPGVSKLPAPGGRLTVVIEKNGLGCPDREWKMSSEKMFPGIFGNCFFFCVGEYAFCGHPH
jgi:hypothetical protein